MLEKRLKGGWHKSKFYTTVVFTVSPVLFHGSLGKPTLREPKLAYAGIPLEHRKTNFVSNRERMEKQKVKKEEKKRDREKEYIAPDESTDRKKKKRKTKAEDED